MKKESLVHLDYIIFSLCLIISICIGVYHGFKSKIYKLFKINSSKTSQSNESEYLQASSSMGTIPIAFSLLASFFSASGLLGTPAEIYVYGIQYWICTFALFLPPIIGAFITGPFFSKLKIKSVYEYFEIRFDTQSIRLFGVLCYVLSNFTSSAIFIYGPATTLNSMINLSNTISICSVGLIVTTYTTIGGLKGVVWTDLFQAFIMLAYIFMIIIKGLIDIGGFGNMWKINSEGGRLNFFNFDFDPFIRQSFWSLLIGNFFYFFSHYCIDQQTLQRFQAAKTIKKAQRAILLNGPGSWLINTLCCLTGLILYAKFYECDPLTDKTAKNPNQLVSLFVSMHLKDIPGAKGLFLASIFSGSLSSVSSALNSLSAIIWQDFLKRFNYFKSFNDKKSVWIIKFIVLTCGLIATGLAFVISILSANGFNLIQLSFGINGPLKAPIIGIFVLGSLFSIVNVQGVITGIVFGFLFSLWIFIGAFIYKPSYEKLSFPNHNCTVVDWNSTVNKSQDFTKIYSLSYMYYLPVGVLITVITGLISSVLTGGLRNNVKSGYLIFDLSKYIRRSKTKSKITDLKLEAF